MWGSIHGLLHQPAVVLVILMKRVKEINVFESCTVIFAFVKQRVDRMRTNTD